MESPTIFKIRSSCEGYLHASLILLTNSLGENLYSLDTLRAIADAEDSALFGCMVGDILVGAAMVGTLKKSGREFYSPFGPDALALLDSHVVGVLRNSAVEAAYRGIGIGRALLSERLQWIKQTGCDYAVGLSWLHGKTRQSDRLYRAAGFTQVGPPVEFFFKSLSQSTGMNCPYCGFPCLCPAAMFAKKL